MERRVLTCKPLFLKLLARIGTIFRRGSGEVGIIDVVRADVRFAVRHRAVAKEIEQRPTQQAAIESTFSKSSDILSLSRAEVVVLCDPDKGQPLVSGSVQPKIGMTQTAEGLFSSCVLW